MSLISPELFEQLLPLVCAWAAEGEQRVLVEGEPLSAAELADARLAGVAQPERVRLLRVARVPMPEHPEVRAAGEMAGMISPHTSGLTLRYGIFIRADSWRRRSLIAHELVHTAQYERLGGFEPFLRQYLSECLAVGYPAAALEQEAIKRSVAICSP